jgi:hypothetical protein
MIHIYSEKEIVSYCRIIYFLLYYCRGIIIYSASLFYNSKILKGINFRCQIESYFEICSTSEHHVNSSPYYYDYYFLVYLTTFF